MTEQPKEPLYSEDTVDKLENIFDTLCTLKQSMSSLQTQIKFLEKGIVKELKVVQKQKRKKIVRAPSGFAKPSLISNELSSFMGLGENTMIARTEVTKFIINYIKENELQKKEDRRYIIPDSKLKKLLYITEDSPELSYFNIQKFMNHHFIKKDKNIVL